MLHKVFNNMCHNITKLQPTFAQQQHSNKPPPLPQKFGATPLDGDTRHHPETHLPTTFQVSLQPFAAFPGSKDTNHVAGALQPFAPPSCKRLRAGRPQLIKGRFIVR